MAWFQFFFFNDTATTEIYTLSLHDALPISACGTVMSTKRCRSSSLVCRLTPHAMERAVLGLSASGGPNIISDGHHHRSTADRKSTRLNSSHANISYAVFCLKKKTQQNIQTP